ncbi:MAG: response regulator transcription factor [Alphaproteobacteria bacterium]
MNTLLLVEDDKMQRQMLRESLEGEDFVVLEAALGRRMLEILDHHRVDLILLDLRLPDGSGLDFIEEIRSRTDVPLIIVSGEHNAFKRICGFETGADDYVDKPFDVDELIARIRANLRRYCNIPSNENALQNTNRVRFAGWVLEREKFQIVDQSGVTGDLTSREFQLLDFLIANAGRAIQRSELCEAIGEKNYIPTPRAIDVKITRIRKKIGDDAGDPQIIKTVRGVGYMFNADAIVCV